MKRKMHALTWYKKNSKERNGVVMKMEKAKRVNGNQEIVYVGHQELYKTDSSRTIHQIRGDRAWGREVWWRARDSRENESRKQGEEKVKAQSTEWMNSFRDTEK
jgi:hypothetical protein